MLSRENEYMIGDALSTLFAYGKKFDDIEFYDISDKISNVIDILNNKITATSIPVGVLKNDIPALGDSKVYMCGDYCFELPCISTPNDRILGNIDIFDVNKINKKEPSMNFSIALSVIEEYKQELNLSITDLQTINKLYIDYKNIEDKINLPIDRTYIDNNKTMNSVSMLTQEMERRMHTKFKVDKINDFIIISANADKNYMSKKSISDTYKVYFNKNKLVKIRRENTEIKRNPILEDGYGKYSTVSEPSLATIASRCPTMAKFILTYIKEDEKIKIMEQQKNTERKSIFKCSFNEICNRAKAEKEELKHQNKHVFTQSLRNVR